MRKRYEDGIEYAYVVNGFDIESEDDQKLEKFRMFAAHAAEHGSALIINGGLFEGTPLSAKTVYDTVETLREIAEPIGVCINPTALDIRALAGMSQDPNESPYDTWFRFFGEWSVPQGKGQKFDIEWCQIAVLNLNTDGDMSKTRDMPLSAKDLGVLSKTVNEVAEEKPTILVTPLPFHQVDHELGAHSWFTRKDVYQFHPDIYKLFESQPHIYRIISAHPTAADQSTFGRRTSVAQPAFSLNGEVGMMTFDHQKKILGYDLCTYRGVPKRPEAEIIQFPGTKPPSPKG